MPDGFLYSQIGYDLHMPMRFLVRSSRADFLSPQATFAVLDASNGEELTGGDLRSWGECWREHWWAGDFTRLDRSGRCLLVVREGSRELWRSEPFAVAEHLLWEQTWRPVALEQLDERARIARNGNGWMDAGDYAWREANSHASLTISLTRLLEAGFRWMTAEEQARVAAHIQRGADYLARCQDKAAALGNGEGALIHEFPGYFQTLPGDVAQAAIAFARASRLLSEVEPARAADYLQRGTRALEWLKRADPPPASGFDPIPHGAPAGYTPPADWMTRELLLFTWAAVELVKAGAPQYQEDALRFARQVIERQVPESAREQGFYGHFYTFSDKRFTEKAVIHHHFGRDCGGTFPFYIIPLIEMTRRWFDHPEVETWRQAIRNFAYGFFLPACLANPFHILPNGIFGAEGLLTHHGMWHGMNLIYGYAAALAVELKKVTGDFRFWQIAAGNLQWIAGLNAGITAESLKGSLKFRAAIPPGTAQPYSMICGVGRQSAGSWTNIRGTICNGFDVDEQFCFNLQPQKSTDGPMMFTDEDWITHSAGWLMGLTELREERMFFRYPAPDGNE